MGEGSAQLIAATYGWHDKDEQRLRIELLTYPAGGVELRISLFHGVRFFGARTIYEGHGAMASAEALRTFNDSVDEFAGQGFQRMTPIPTEYALEIAEAVAYVAETGRQPLLDENFRIKSGEGGAVKAAASAVAVDLRGDAFKGFDGFVTFDELRNGGLDEVPPSGGVYVVIRRSKEDPVFLDESCGGHFKGKNPGELVDVLTAKWVADTPVVYIGKGDSLRRRLKEYAAFGAGRPVGHWGGRYIWQLADRDELLVAWKRCEDGRTAAELEGELVAGFKAANGGRLPFANIADPSRP